jgi:hypothetical protein
MEIKGYPVRAPDVVWRDIAGEVVIAERSSSTVHVLNKTGSFIWTLADGTKQMEDMITALCNKFEVTAEEARADAEEFCLELLQEGLVSLENVSRVVQEV